MKRIIKIIGLSVIAATLISGCATSELQTQSKLTKTIVLDHSKNESKTIYLQVTNTAGSGGENMDLFSRLKEKLEAKGYKVISSSKDAEYGLFINVLFANNLKEAYSIKNAMGTGVLAGTSTAIAGGSGGDSLLVGATIALGAGIIGTMYEDEVFRAVVDISVRDYLSKDVSTVRTQYDNGASVHDTARAGDLNQLGGNLGIKEGASDMSSGISESVTTATVKDFEEFKTRAFVEAVRMDLKIDEAMPVMEAKITQQISNLF